MFNKPRIRLPPCRPCWVSVSHAGVDAVIRG